MHRLWLSGTFLLLVSCLFAQQPDSTNADPKKDIQIPPSFPGGEAALMQYLDARLNPPDPKLCGGRGGKALFTFVIEKDGQVSNVQVAQSLCPKFDSIAMRILSDMPRWEPGSSNGNPVKVRYTLPLTLHPPAPAFVYNPHFRGGLYVDGGVALNTGGFGQHILPLGFVDFGVYFGGEKTAFEFGTTWLFSSVKEPFQFNGAWEDGRKISVISINAGLRRRVWRQKRHEVALHAGVAGLLLIPVTSKDTDPEGFTGSAIAPWLGVTHYLLLREKTKNGYLNSRRFKIQLKWRPLFFDDPVRGSFFSLGVGMDWLQRRAG
ncbi:MAG: hypothetical protein DYG98_07280 [Haliscomenobacteraceae bacterium CHB4]|nr:hypothetical protein [Saprospiraceae bacterium]MCE7922842.1 hypothetical protein [Haliscomenobacteraceae bacterium CHB4]